MPRELPAEPHRIDPGNTVNRKPHADAAEALVEAAEDRGLKVGEKRWAVTDGAMYPEPGSRLHVPTARLFGTIGFEPTPGIELPDGIVISYILFSLSN